MRGTRWEAENDVVVGAVRRLSGGGRGGGWGLCVAAVAGCGAAGRFRRLGFGARSRAAVAPITVLSLASKRGTKCTQKPHVQKCMGSVILQFSSMKKVESQNM